MILFSISFALAQTLPAKVKKYLNKSYRGWKLSAKAVGCSASTVRGDFDSDRKTDYAIKILKGNKGYILAFLERKNSYEAHVLQRMSASELKNTALGIYRKGDTWATGDMGDENSALILLKNDAPFDGPCESDAIGIHVYQNGSFVMM